MMCAKIIKINTLVITEMCSWLPPVHKQCPPYICLAKMTPKNIFL